jgi:hypothetical protein
MGLSLDLGVLSPQETERLPQEGNQLVPDFQRIYSPVARMMSSQKG